MPYFVDIDGTGEIFQSRLPCKYARAMFFSILGSYKRKKLKSNFSCLVEKNG